MQEHASSFDSPAPFSVDPFEVVKLADFIRGTSNEKIKIINISGLSSSAIKGDVGVLYNPATNTVWETKADCNFTKHDLENKQIVNLNMYKIGKWDVIANFINATMEK